MRSLPKDKDTTRYSRANVATLSTDRVFGFLLHEWSRRVCALGLAALTWAKLSGQGWPWWAWVPAMILAAMGGYLLVILLAYVYQKRTYQLRARLIKKQLRQLPDDTTPINIAPDVTNHGEPEQR